MIEIDKERFIEILNNHKIAEIDETDEYNGAGLRLELENGWLIYLSQTDCPWSRHSGNITMWLD